MTFKHPTGNNPKTVHVVACGATTRDYWAANMQYNVPLPPACEVWTLNKNLRFLKSDFGFVLDDLVGERIRSQQYFLDICKASHSTPIMTSFIDPTASQIIEQGEGRADNFYQYPIHDIRDALGRHFWEVTSIAKPEGMADEEAITRKGNQMLYMKNSLPMIMAYAWFIGVERIVVFGADYSHPASNGRERDQPNAEYWCGFIEALGVELVLTSDTTLKSTREGRDLYGYGVRQPIL